MRSLHYAMGSACYVRRMRLPRLGLVATSVAFIICVACSGGDDEPGTAPAPVVDGAPPPPANDASSGDAGPKDDATAPRRDFGVSFSPIGFGGPVEDWLPQRAAFYAAREAHGRVVSFHFGWRDPGPSRPACGTVPAIQDLLDQDTAAHRFTLSIVLGWSEGDGTPDLDCGGGDNTWSNAVTRAKYKDVAVALAARFRPAYLFLGNEVNTWYLGHEADWSRWVTELADVANAVRAASPSTLVGTTYQWEHLRGGGTKNGWTDPPQWELLTDVAGKIDIVGITTYPYFDVDTPSAIPVNHYAELLARFQGPIALTEIGWRGEAGAPYAGSAADQAAAPAAILDKIPDARLRYATWLFLNEPAANAPPFVSAALRDATGKPRPVDAAWQDIVRARQSP